MHYNNRIEARTRENYLNSSAANELLSQNGSRFVRIADIVGSRADGIHL